MFSMTQTCFLCKLDIGNTSLIFKKSDLPLNHLSIPDKITEGDVLCVNCFNQLLKSPITNISKARIDKLVVIFVKEMDKNEINIDFILEKLNTEMTQWSGAEAEKTE